MYLYIYKCHAYSILFRGEKQSMVNICFILIPKSLASKVLIIQIQKPSQALPVK